MQIRTLTTQHIDDLLEAFNDAFADYMVPFELDAEQLLFKIASENIQLEWSVGFFEKEKLIAFMMHGVRVQSGKTVLYNAGTGVLPEYRGQGLVGKMYNYIRPFLRTNQVEEIVLEVIENNQSAIRAYEKIGFVKKRKLWCFAGEIHTTETAPIASIQTLADFPYNGFQSFWDVIPSWQSDGPSMEVVQPQAFGAFVNDKLVGYLLFNPLNRRLYQIAVAPAYRRKRIGTQLLACIQQKMPQEKVQFNNVDEEAENLQLFLKKRGMINIINQLEMVKEL
jgi:ribosomal protein S18 acetylase RimI-like enzyme